MNRRMEGLLLLGALLAAACGTSAEPQAEAEGGSADLVRGATDSGHPAVVGVYSAFCQGSCQEATTRACTGTYIAPRLVLTAAHCLPPTPSGRVWVFHGTEFYAALKAGIQAAPPGQPSDWAAAENWRLHPEWDTQTLYADMAVVFLDRELPMAPIPVAPWRLERRDLGKLGTMVGFGATKAFDPLITQTEGAGTKRSGKAPFIGSPPQSPKPVDPHPGLDLPEVRASLAMFDGRAPRANTCAGDSGGPLLMRRGGQEYVYGVSTWTGDYCEEFSYYTRIDPFLPFIEESVHQAGNADITPTLQCVADRGDGTLRAYFGYQSENLVTVSIPHGPRNRLPLDGAAVRPTSFTPGEHLGAFGVTFTADQQVVWRLQPPWSRPHVLVAGRDSPRCDPDDVMTQALQACDVYQPARCSDLETCFWNYAFTLQDGAACMPQIRATFECERGLAPEAWTCDEWGDAVDSTGTCTALREEMWNCVWGG